MTRINVIEPKLLTDQHLLAEHRELTRIPNSLISGKLKQDSVIPDHYLLGSGHVKFFINKLHWLKKRYDELHEECMHRKFNVIYKWPSDDSTLSHLKGSFHPAKKDILLNYSRIIQRYPKKARYMGEPIDIDTYMDIVNMNI